MWRQVALPVILVALSWLAVSGSTNFYLQWLEDSYQQVFDENVTSMHSASLVQQEQWRLHAEIIARWDRKQQWEPLLKAFDQETQAPLRTLVQRAGSPAESGIVRAISELMHEYRGLLQDILSQGTTQPTDRGIQDRLLSLAVQISEKADDVR